MIPDKLEQRLDRDYIFLSERTMTAGERGLRNRLKKTGHKLRRAKHVYDDLAPNDQVNAAQLAMQSFADVDTAQAYMRMQMGSEELIMEEASLQDLEPHARERILGRHRDNAATLWPWVAVAVTPRIAYEYLSIYRELAARLGLFPSPPEIANVPNQRLVRFEDRALAAELIYIQRMAQTGSWQEAGRLLLDMEVDAKKSYELHSIPILQQAVAVKVTDPERMTGIRSSAMWKDIESLSAMATDRGLRDGILGNYHILRNVRYEGVSGYKIGQGLLAYRAMLGAIRTY